MLIPLTGKISRRNPPVITIALILINCLVFFIFQWHDGEKRHGADEYYIGSGLSKIELSHYIRYLKDRGKIPDEELPDDGKSYEKIDKKLLAEYSDRMDEDLDYYRKLRKNEIITRGDSDYEEWKDLRKGYEERLSKIVSENYCFNTADPRPVTIVTHMFLHGGVGHLLGNMVFLWLTGCMLEMGCGRVIFPGLYMLTGVIALFTFWGVVAGTKTGMLGASGAISGLMGAFTVLYGRKRVKVFLALGVYFHYMKIPAIFLLPVWIATELYGQLVSSATTNVAYMAHFGGIVGGAALACLLLKIPGALNRDAFKEEPPKDTVSPLVERALDRVSELDMAGGRELLVQALEKDPDNRTILTHLFNVQKLAPEQDAFHETTQRLLDNLSRDANSFQAAHGIYCEYMKETKYAKLSPQLYFRLSQVFSSSGHPEKSEKILAMFLKKKPNFPGIPAALLKLANAYRDQGINERWSRCLKVIQSRYPDSMEAGVAQQALKKQAD